MNVRLFSGAAFSTPCVWTWRVLPWLCCQSLLCGGTGGVQPVPCRKFQWLLQRQASKVMYALLACAGQRFDETAASVRRLLRRDRKDLQASSGTWQPEWDDSSANDAADDQSAQRRESGTTSTSAPTGQGAVPSRRIKDSNLHWTTLPIYRSAQVA